MLYLWRQCICGRTEGPFVGVVVLHFFDVVERSDLHVSEEGHNLQLEEDLVHLLQTKSALLIQLVHVHLVGVDEEEAESHDFDKHVLLGRRQIRFVLEHLLADADDVAEKVFVVFDLLQVVLEGVSDLALGGQKHGQIL